MKEQMKFLGRQIYFNTYTFINSKSYRFYRLYILDENGRGYIVISEFKLIEAQ